MNEPLMTADQITKMCGFSKATFYRLKKSESNFPEELRITTKTIRYRQQDVTDWLNSRACL